MALDTIVSIAATIVLIVGPFVLLALAAARFGADSRPGLDDRDRRPGLVATY